MSRRPPLSELYTLGPELGRGAFGVVRRARDLRRGRDVAVKLSLGSPDEDLVARVAREAVLFRDLSHPRLARLLDARLDEGGRLALVYELVAGQSLDQVLASRRPSPGEVATWAEDLGEALEVLRQADLVHRDVKAANLMVEPDGRLRLLDFGLARAASGQTLTATGAILGTPTSMAPEQILGTRAGPAADAYAMACVLHEALAGAPPFSGDPGEVLTAHLKVAPPRLRAPVPTPAAEALLRGLAKRPDQRPSARQLGQAVAVALRAAAAAPSPSATAVHTSGGAALQATSVVDPGAPAPTSAHPPPGAPGSTSVQGDPGLPNQAPAQPATPSPRPARGRRGLALGAAGLALLGLGWWLAAAPPLATVEVRPAYGGAWLRLVDGAAPVHLEGPGGPRALTPDQPLWIDCPGGCPLTAAPSSPSTPRWVDPAGAARPAHLEPAPAPDLGRASWFASTARRPPMLAIHLPADLPRPTAVEVWRERVPRDWNLRGAPRVAPTEPGDGDHAEAAQPEEGDRSEADRPGDGSTWFVPRALAGEFPTDRQDRLAAPPPLLARARFGGEGAPWVALPSLWGTLERVDYPCSEQDGDFMTAKVGPVPLEGGDLLFADDHGHLYLRDARTLATRGVFSYHPLRDDDVRVPLLVPGPDQTAWYLGVHEAGAATGRTRRLARYPAGRWRITRDQLDAASPPANQGPWTACPLGIRPLAAPPEAERLEVDYPAIDRVEPMIGPDGARAAVSAIGLDAVVALAPPGRPPIVAELFRDHRAVNPLPIPPFRAGGGWAVGWELVARDSRRPHPARLAAVDERGTLRWTLDLARSPEAAPIAVPGGMLLLLDGVLRKVSDAFLKGKKTWEQLLAAPPDQVQVLGDLNDTTRNTREPIFTSALLWTEAHGLDVFHWPGRPDGSPSAMHQFSPSRHDLVWYRAGPDLVPDPASARKLSTRGGIPEEENGIHGLVALPGRGVAHLVLVDDHSSLRWMALDLEARALLFDFTRFGREMNPVGSRKNRSFRPEAAPRMLGPDQGAPGVVDAYLPGHVEALVRWRSAIGRPRTGGVGDTLPGQASGRGAGHAGSQ